MASPRATLGYAIVGCTALVVAWCGRAWPATSGVSAQGTDRSFAYLPLAVDNVGLAQLPAAPTAAPTTIASATRRAATSAPTTAATTAATPVTTSSPSPTADPTDAIPTPTPTVPVSASCGAVPAFHDGKSPSRVVWVAPGGDDGTGDGSVGRPFATLRRAAREAAPGIAIRLAPGRYAGGTYLDDVAGTEGAPIWIGGAPGSGPGAGGAPAADAPVIAGSSEGLHLTRARWVVVHDVVVEGASGNGINADDGGSVAAEATSFSLAFERVVIRDIGGGGNQDCLKLSGLRDVVVRDSAFRRCGGGGSGSGIDMVGVHDAVVARSQFDDISGNAVQAKGGSTNIEVRANRMRAAGNRAVNMGGSTGFAYFRPPLDPAGMNAEARDVRVVANWIEGSEAAVAYVGCVACLAAHNTIVDPGRWVLRILQETRDSGGFAFEPARDGVFANNVVVFRAGVLRTAVNVGDATAPETFVFRNNLWFASDAPTRSAPQLPVTEQGTVIGRDPRLGEDGAIESGSPAARAGMRSVGVAGDLVGACYGDPPSIGAREVP